MSSQQAPLVCICGTPLCLIREEFDPEAHVHVGHLRCPHGHEWLDIRRADELRRHLPC